MSTDGPVMADRRRIEQLHAVVRAGARRSRGPRCCSVGDQYVTLHPGASPPTRPLSRGPGLDRRGALRRTTRENGRHVLLHDDDRRSVGRQGRQDLAKRSVRPSTSQSAMIRWVVRNFEPMAGPGDGIHSRPRASRVACTGGRTRARLAFLTLFPTSPDARPIVPRVMSIFGFVTKSTAPSSRARSVISHPRSRQRRHHHHGGGARLHQTARGRRGRPSSASRRRA